MSENAVTAVIAFLFGGMIFLLAYTRIGGLAAALLALAILFVYLAVEAWQAWRQGRASRIERAAVYRRWDQWRVVELHNWIEWAFTPWPGGSATDDNPTEFTDVHNYRNAYRIHPDSHGARRQRASSIDD